jgi:hypothetical protein
MVTTTLQQKRKRKALLVLPAIVFALSTLLFRTLGGGRASAENLSASQAPGFNTHLPDARLKEEQGLNKLSYYDRAAADSAKLKQAEQTDPYAKRAPNSASGQAFAPPALFFPRQPTALETAGIKGDDGPDAKEALIHKRLAELQAVINKPAATQTGAQKNAGADPVNGSPAGAEQNPLLNRPPVAEDPELKQMNCLLEKILDIQHPERLKEKTAEVALNAAPGQFRAIPAVIEGNQKIVQGTVIRMRLLDSVRLNGQLFAKGQLIYGSGDLYNQRVKINIKLIHVGQNIIPVDLTVYDRTDGMEGISVPEAVTGEALRNGAVSGLQSMDMMSLDPSVTAQLTAAGINTAKGLFAKKVKRVKGKLKDGHELLLRDNKGIH